MIEHPHAWVLRAIADGEPMESFEIKPQEVDCWTTLRMSALAYTEWVVRRKLRTIR